MGQSLPFGNSRRDLLTHYQSIYDSHRFLDVYEASADYWKGSTSVDELSAEELVFAGRLASRLGGARLSRHCFREARKRDPRSPLVRYFARHLDGSRHLLLDELLEFEKNPELGGDDAELRASWLAGYAYTFGILRDFARARDLLNRARELSPNSAWVLSQEADILGMADLWRDSLQSAERGCKADSASPWPILSRANALLNLGEIGEAVRHITEAAERSQSFQVVQTACWYHCALAETLEGDQRRETLESAKRLAERIEPMAPLADRDFRTSLARTWLDVAAMADDSAGVERWAQAAGSPFHRQVLANLKANPHGKCIRLGYRRTIQKHVECVPTSVASALSATGATVSVEELAREVTFGGTAEWAAADWLREKGFYVRFFSATAEITARLIDAGIGFTISWDDDESGHCVAIVGIDHAAGIVIAHDPMSFRSSEYLLSGFTAEYGPLGLSAMATVPSSMAGILDAILPPDSGVNEAAEAHRRALTLYGPAAARPTVEDVEGRFPGHPGTRYLRAIQDLEDGRVGRALGGFKSLLDRFPRSPAVRVRLMNACRLLGNTALLRETLRSVVETGKVPGVGSDSDWSTPHPRYFYDYADLLRSSAETWTQSESLLRSALRKDCRAAGAWHVLADLRWGQRDRDSAILAYRIASTLAGHNEHYAVACADVLCRSGRTAEGVEWLQRRAENLGTSVHGVSTWISYIGLLEDQGNPLKALEVCRDVLGRTDSAASLLSFAVPFFARMGRWDEAGRCFEALRQTGAGPGFREAAVYYCEMRGMTAAAIDHAESWAEESPLSIPARNRLLNLVAQIQGNPAALARAARWLRERPENEDFEELFCRQVEFPIYPKLRVLNARVQRNHDDAWAWRELAFAAIAGYRSSGETHRQRMQERILRYLRECDRLTAGDAATVRAWGLWHEVGCRWEDACACFVKSIRLDPSHPWGYRRAFEVSARFSAEQRRALWTEIEPVWLASPGHLPNCLETMRQLTDLFGPRETEKILDNWRVHRPDDPNVAEAAADLLLDFGHGRSDAGRALDLLRPAVESYPYHPGLRFSLAKALRAAGDGEAAHRAFEELVERRPDNLAALIQLALVCEREGRTDEALGILTRAAEQQPHSPDPLDTRAQILMDNRRFDEALGVLDDALRRLPDSVPIYERTIALFARIGEDEKAVEAARQGVRTYPRGAYLWLLLGRTLREHREFAAPGEVERCLRRSLELNRGLLETADLLAIILTEQRRYDDAFGILSDVELRVADPSPVLGRRAWIRYQSGDKQEAISELASVVEHFPGYRWGWEVLLDWLEQDKEWQLARKVLGTVPPQMIAVVAFRRARLLLLDKAGAEKSSLDSEWVRLLDDFPEDVPLHLNRYDSLRDAKRRPEAVATLERVAQVAEDDVYFLTRLAEVRCQEGRFDDASDCALKVCFAPVEHSVWPVNRVWEVFATAKREESLAEMFRARLNSQGKGGAQPTRRALSRYAEYMVAEEVPQLFAGKLFRETRLNSVARKIHSLMRAVDRSSWREDFHEADLFAILNGRKYPRLVIRFWKGMCDRGRNGDSDAWAQAGRAMVNLRRYREARKLFRNWRTRRGVQMWSLANYIQCLSAFRRSHLEEAIGTCRDALADLPHDHCARYLAFLQAEALALVGDKEGLAAVGNDRRGYFDGGLKEGEYFKTNQKYLLEDVPKVIQAVQWDNTKGYRRLVWRLRLRRIRNHDDRGALRIAARVIGFLAFYALIQALFRQ